jgi:hypothetical protein
MLIGLCPQQLLTFKLRGALHATQSQPPHQASPLPFAVQSALPGESATLPLNLCIVRQAQLDVGGYMAIEIKMHGWSKQLRCKNCASHQKARR